jgi:hypothetical protein
MPENIRQEALNALATLATADPGFVVDAFADLEATLEAYGFTLTEEEIEEVRDFQRRNPRRVYGFWRHHAFLRD